MLPFLLWLSLVPLCAATACFWAAVLAVKGGPLHRAAGRAFARSVYATAWMGAGLAFAGLITLSGYRPAMWPVFYVALILAAPVQHGLAVVRAGPSPGSLRSRTHAWLNLLAMAGTVLLLAGTAFTGQWVLLVITPIGFVIGLRNMSYAARSAAMPREWEAEHLTSMVTAGVVLHTVLIAMTRWSGLVTRDLGGPLRWFAPAIIGLAAITWLRARRRRA